MMSASSESAGDGRGAVDRASASVTISRQSAAVASETASPSSEAEAMTNEHRESEIT
ncbi:unannotated protein [freshwater metagenome]|uniref:Unannotated protein n=1 Tax=freshwater metagenome TaxID=449393 RepID=A0A6J7ID01_9ZZZZ